MGKGRASRVPALVCYPKQYCLACLSWLPVTIIFCCAKICCSISNGTMLDLTVQDPCTPQCGDILVYSKWGANASRQHGQPRGPATGMRPISQRWHRHHPLCEASLLLVAPTRTLKCMSSYMICHQILKHLNILPGFLEAERDLVLSMVGSRDTSRGLQFKQHPPPPPPPPPRAGATKVGNQFGHKHHAYIFCP